MIPTGATPLRQIWVPRRDARASTSSHMTAPPLETLHNQEQEIPADVVAPVHDDSIATNSFSFALQNVTDDIPQGRLPGPVIPMLELVTDGENDDVHSRDVAQTQQDSQNLEILVAASPRSQTVEHVAVHGSPTVEESHDQLHVVQLPIQTVPEGAADSMATVATVQEQPVLFSSVSPQQEASLDTQ